MIGAFKNKLFLGAFLLGIGLIGMLDGIIFHQILQWHSIYMHTNRFYQIVSDGLFHLLVTIFVFLGAYCLWKSDSYGGFSVFWGGLILGGGVFNLVEGIVDHHILQIHHVRYGVNQFAYDIAFDILGLVMIIFGWFLYKGRVFGKSS